MNSGSTMMNNVADYSKTVQSFESKGLPKGMDHLTMPYSTAEGIVLWSFDEVPDARGDVPGRMPQHHYIPTSVMNAVLKKHPFPAAAIIDGVFDAVFDATGLKVAAGDKEVVSKFGFHGVEWEAGDTSISTLWQRIRLLGVHMPTTNHMAGHGATCSYTFTSAVQVKDYWTQVVSESHGPGGARKPKGLFNGTRLGFVLILEDAPAAADGTAMKHFKLQPAVMSEEMRHTSALVFKISDILKYFPIGTVLDGTSFKDTNNRVSCHGIADGSTKIPEGGQATLYLALNFK